jgi:hypothetical protein
LESEEHSAAWFAALLRIIEQETIHGLIRGRCARLLLDAGRIESSEVARRLSLAMSRGSDPAQTARWIEGFLSGSGLLLLHDSRLLNIIDEWLVGIQAEVFTDLLPLLRRTFSTFPAPERRQIGQVLAAGTSARRDQEQTDAGIDHDRAAKALPLLIRIFGGTP